jgi:hypothetical protein
MDERQRQQRDDKLDEALDETFPASDPPANTVETGIRVGPPIGPDEPVSDNVQASRFELVKDGSLFVPAVRAQG